jgi:hypothetical protein
LPLRRIESINPLPCALMPTMCPRPQGQIICDSAAHNSPVLHPRRPKGESEAYRKWRRPSGCPLWVKSGHPDRRAACPLSANSGPS